MRPEVQSTPTAGVVHPSGDNRSRRRLGDILVELGFAERGVLEATVALAREDGLPIGQALLASGLVDSNQLARALAERNGLDYVDLNLFKVDNGAANLISSTEARRYGAIPIAFVDERDAAGRHRRSRQRARPRQHRDVDRAQGPPGDHRPGGPRGVDQPAHPAQRLRAGDRGRKPSRRSRSPCSSCASRRRRRRSSSSCTR